MALNRVESDRTTLDGRAPTRRPSKRLLVAGVAAFAVSFASAVPVDAAPSRAGDDAPIINSGLTSVAPITGRGYLLSASLATDYDSNILRLGDGFASPQTPGAAPRSKADFRFSPAVTAAIAMPVGRQQVFLGGDLGRDFYARNTQLNRNRYAIGGGLNWRVGVSCSGTVAGEFRSRQSLLSELSQLIDNVQHTLAYGASAHCQAPVGLGFGGTVRRNEIRNQNPTRAQFDVNSTVYSPEITYSLPALGQFSLGGSVVQVRYPNRPVTGFDGTATRQADDGVNIISGRVGYTRAVGSRLTVQLGASYIDTKPKPETILTPIPGTNLSFPQSRPGYKGLGYDAAITYHPSSRLTATLLGNRQVTSTANVGALFVIQRSLGLDIDYKVGPAITAGIGVTQDKRDYRGNFSNIVDPNARIGDTINRVYGQLVYDPVPLYSVALEVAHQNRDSNPAIYNYKSTSALLTLRVKLGRNS